MSETGKMMMEVMVIVADSVLLLRRLLVTDRRGTVGMRRIFSRERVNSVY